MPSYAIATHHHIRRALLLALGIAVLVVAAAVSAASAHAGAVHFRPKGRDASYRQVCGDPYSDIRDPTNPLALATPPGPNPLTGANFYVPGPAHGSAASAIAQLVGLNPKKLPSDESWASFAQQLTFGPLAAKLAADPGLAQAVSELSMIAAEPEAQRIYSFDMGGGPGAIFKQTSKIFCQNMEADPGSIPIFNTYFLHADLGGCPTPADVRNDQPVFERRVNEMTTAVANRPAVFLLEVDGIGSSGCVRKMGALPLWEADLRYEMDAVQALPHTVVYVEGGYSDGNSVGYTARVLSAIGINNIRGFFTNDTHENWTINEIDWATKVSDRLGGQVHFVVNTADNGQGALINHNRVHNGNEDLCNAPGRGLGPRDTTVTGFPLADAYLWTHPPGNSSGHCNGGPSGGVFWPARAEGEAQRANAQLGPGFPSLPY